MKLLSEVLKNKVPTANQPLKELVPRIFPFLHHSSSGVRKSALQTLESLTSRSDLASEFLPDICGVLMSHLFQRALFEYYDYNLELIEKSWSNICANCAPTFLNNMTTFVKKCTGKFSIYVLII